MGAAVRRATAPSTRGSADAPSLAGTNNPVLPGLNADPQIALFDGVYYIYPTTDGFANWTSTTFSVFSSTNLVDWTDRGVILDLPRDLTWATGHAWAPAITRVGGTYYFYFCADQQIGVATASSPVGPFKDALGHPLIATTAYGTHSIDPYLFTDDDGTNYLYFGSGTNGARVVKLGADMKSLVGTPANITPSGASGVVEGTLMFKRNGTYYLQWSEGDTRNATYQVAYAKAQSPTGPFTRLGVILSQNPTLGNPGPRRQHRPRHPGARRVLHRLPPLQDPGRRRDAPRDLHRPDVLQQRRNDRPGRAHVERAANGGRAVTRTLAPSASAEPMVTVRRSRRAGPRRRPDARRTPAAQPPRLNASPRRRYASRRSTTMLPRVAFEYGQISWAARSSASPSARASSGASATSSTAMPTPLPPSGRA